MPQLTDRLMVSVDNLFCLLCFVFCFILTFPGLFSFVLSIIFKVFVLLCLLKWSTTIPQSSWLWCKKKTKQTIVIVFVYLVNLLISLIVHVVALVTNQTKKTNKSSRRRCSQPVWPSAILSGPSPSSAPSSSSYFRCY